MNNRLVTAILGLALGVAGIGYAPAHATPLVIHSVTINERLTLNPHTGMLSVSPYFAVGQSEDVGVFACKIGTFTNYPTTYKYEGSTGNAPCYGDASKFSLDMHLKFYFDRAGSAWAPQSDGDGQSNYHCSLESGVHLPQANPSFGCFMNYNGLTSSGYQIKLSTWNEANVNAGEVDANAVFHAYVCSFGTCSQDKPFNQALRIRAYQNGDSDARVIQQ